MRAPYSKVPALPAVVGLATGIFVYVSWGISLWWIALLVAFGGFCALYFKRWWEAFVLLFTALGMALAYVGQAPLSPTELLGEKIMVKGRVERRTEKEATIDYLVDVGTVAFAKDSLMTDCNFRLLLTSVDFETAYEVGDEIAAIGVLEVVQGKLDVPDKVDYGKYLFIDGCTARMFVNSENVACEGNTASFFERTSASCRAVIADAIVCSGVDGQTASLLLALLLGDDSLLNKDIEDDFRDSGLAHMLALSGLHLAILLGLATMMFGFVKAIPGGRVVYLWLLVILVLSYALLVGMSPSVARAAVMVAVFLIGRILQVKSYPYNTLCVTVFVWLLINPLWLYSVGFQLSVLAVFALIWLNDRIRGWHINSHALRRIILLVAVPVVCVLATSVLTVFYFHQVPVFFLLTNILAGMLIVPFLALGAISTILTLCGLSIPGLAPIINGLAAAILSVASSFSDNSWAVIDNVYPTLPQLILWALSLVAIVWAVTRRNRRGIIVLSLCLLATCLSVIFEPDSTGEEIYITSDKSTTRILMRSGTRAVLFLPAAEGNRNLQEDVHERASREYADFLGKRRVDSLELADGDFVCGKFERNSSCLNINGKQLLYLAEDSIPNLSHSPDYLLVCGKYKGDICETALLLRAKEVLIGADINKTRRRRYYRELQDAGIPCRDLVQSPFAWTIE